MTILIRASFRKKKIYKILTTFGTLFQSFLLNKDAMNPYAAGLSIFVSMLSALTIIGWPVEAFLYGDAIVWRLLGGILGLLMAIELFIPLLHRF